MESDDSYSALKFVSKYWPFKINEYMVIQNRCFKKM